MYVCMYVCMYGKRNLLSFVPFGLTFGHSHLFFKDHGPTVSDAEAAPNIPERLIPITTVSVTLLFMPIIIMMLIYSTSKVVVIREVVFCFRL